MSHLTSTQLSTVPPAVYLFHLLPTHGVFMERPCLLFQDGRVVLEAHRIEDHRSTRCRTQGYPLEGSLIVVYAIKIYPTRGHSTTSSHWKCFRRLFDTAEYLRGCCVVRSVHLDRRFTTYGCVPWLHSAHRQAPEVLTVYTPRLTSNFCIEGRQPKFLRPFMEYYSV